MKYLLLIYEAPDAGPKPGTPEQRENFQRYADFTEWLTESGHNLGGDALEPVTTATTVRVREGDVVVSDGPFAETKEHLGGFYAIEANDLDTAIDIASKIPSAQYGSIEVRPIWDWSQDG